MAKIFSNRKDIAIDVLSMPAILQYIVSTGQGSPQRQIINDVIKKYPDLENILRYRNTHGYIPRRTRGFFGFGRQNPIFGGKSKSRRRISRSKRRR